MNVGHFKGAPAASSARHAGRTLRLRLDAAAIGLACVMTVGCRPILGLDDPTLDPCASGCVDGEVLRDATLAADGAIIGDSGLESDGPSAIDAPLSDAANDSPEGALPDAGAVHGVQCGAPSAATFCTAAEPVCCRISGDATVRYTCVAGAVQCAGNDDYAILCSGTDTCGATQVCCHFNSAMKCETAKSCQSGGGDRVCDPTLPADCGDASTCSRPISALPYFECAP